MEGLKGQFLEPREAPWTAAGLWTLNFEVWSLIFKLWKNNNGKHFKLKFCLVSEIFGEGKMVKEFSVRVGMEWKRYIESQTNELCSQTVWIVEIFYN